MREDRARVWAAYEHTRSRTGELVAGLSPEDQGLQSMGDTSPTKWHLAHTTWFFEAVVLQSPAAGDYRVFNEDFSFLFNSYYEALSPRHPRGQRGLLSRPSLSAVWAYRHYVDKAILAFIATAGERVWTALAPLIELGVQHEQQHQELIVTDILHAFSVNPTLPAWHASLSKSAPQAATLKWVRHDGGLAQVGHSGPAFSVDNETPRHQVWLAPFEIANRLVTNAEFMDLVLDGGYRKPGLWLSEGWAQVQAQGWDHPLYWLPPGNSRAPAESWQSFGPAGVQPLDPDAAVSHLSFFEAAAYAQFAGARLPTEAEWEVASAGADIVDMDGVVWQWTRSSHDPYPGFKPSDGAVAEYNGKFMVGQTVLRGSSAFTPVGHSRRTYRNFFPPAARWQLSGLRLARDTE
ncbi:ergothioneine biosynthesis protein EgtB [Caenimonas soli]|uniref:ergothioneine biosynthesis protein EgtB n=1 Tax=Caenimonas soli TaxID=2735555 RepID=UPI001556FD27|nr:ergothioneine biosynthesis protein EgtB [Caenimonas soli]NPC59160.1 ergothioneine biosynthesis protein EgtB [Caenimonas soli]